ncbi:hypothetical protein BU24DRAFT_462393 [Aaosphaeria arxii CBS 175.79]|uniref:Rhodopsin domain-containing protein n=1 Tax=Aaosphaeria arxii CBS 175.79 TaxID=1450172 RepID=A0A6A5XSP7_9PLEO|nr:uncharacterized protein BU24DRAFT_462393 [Aaosphaeria arxii CBS 175.79]KAF2016212.1 hypothetical protein BU24DRAFT_462393 [Aaosphaeria arxii CBS 175.79]
MAIDIAIECRAEYGVGTCIILLRFFTRCKTVGWRNLYWDDFFAFTAWVFFTLIYAMVEFLGVVGAPIAMTQEQREALPDAMKKSFREGAKGMFASFYFLIFLVWSLKGTLIFLFLHLTKNTKMHRYVQAVGVVSIVCCVAALITQTTHCLPLKRNWQILPDPGKECSAGIIINIVIAIGNVLVDCLLLVVPIKMLKDAHMSLWRKARIMFLLSLGLFVIGMAIARCILSIGTSVQVALASVWAQREALVSIFAVNAPVLNTLFKRETWTTQKSNSKYSNGYASNGGHSKGNDSTLGPKKHDHIEIYKMTDIETSSRESTSELVNASMVEWQSHARSGKKSGSYSGPMG